MMFSLHEEANYKRRKSLHNFIYVLRRESQAAKIKPANSFGPPICVKFYTIKNIHYVCLQNSSTLPSVNHNHNTFE